MSKINNHQVNMKGKLTVIFTGTMFAAISVILPASALKGHAYTLNVAGSGFDKPISQHQNQMLLAKGDSSKTKSPPVEKQKIGNRTTQSSPTDNKRKLGLKHVDALGNILNNGDQIIERHQSN